MHFFCGCLNDLEAPWRQVLVDLTKESWHGDSMPCQATIKDHSLRPELSKVRKASRAHEGSRTQKIEKNGKPKINKDTVHWQTNNKNIIKWINRQMNESNKTTNHPLEKKKKQMSYNDIKKKKKHHLKGKTALTKLLRLFQEKISRTDGGPSEVGASLETHGVLGKPFSWVHRDHRPDASLFSHFQTAPEPEKVQNDQGKSSKAAITNLNEHRRLVSPYQQAPAKPTESNHSWARGGRKVCFCFQEMA